MHEETGFCPRCGAKMDSKEEDSESNCGDVLYPKRSPLEDTESNETEGVRKKISEKEMMTWWKLDVGTGILTLRKDDDSKKLYDGGLDVSKGMRLTVTRKRGDSVHVVVPCNLEKNAKLHQFTNADGINMSAIYTEDEDGEFEEASCMLADEGKMIAWWNELHRKKD
jgi:NADH pyrophosphatase NudC (nudix superfamily)